MLFLFFVLLSLNANANPLTLQGYLDQTEANNPAVAASKNIVHGSLESSTEAKLVTSPTFFAEGKHLSDQKESASAFAGTKTLGNSFSAGIQERFGFGLDAKLSYSIVNAEISGAPPTVFANGLQKSSIAITQLELSQSLWRNFFGKETRATADLIEAGALATRYVELQNLKNLLVKGETTYYRLVLARDAVKLGNELLDRSKKILDWATRRTNVHLTDKIDMLQAKAAYQYRKLGLKTQQDEERAARLSFNALRNNLSEEVPEELSEISTQQILALVAIQKTASSFAVKAAEEGERLEVAKNELASQKVLPDLSLFGSAAYNGLDNSLSPAMNESFSNAHPTYAFGVRLTMPLFFWMASEVRAGHLKQQLGAEALTRQRKLEYEHAWNDTYTHLEEAKDRLKLVEELVSNQKEKLDYEKYRLNLGRTTTYQVLVFEQDYAEAVLTRLKIENEILSVNSKLKSLTDTTTRF